MPNPPFVDCAYFYCSRNTQQVKRTQFEVRKERSIDLVQTHNKLNHCIERNMVLR